MSQNNHHPRNLLPGVGITALTLLNGATYRQAALAAGVDDLVYKAELTTDLLPAIRVILTESDEQMS